MKILAGIYKNRTLTTVNGLNIRPTTALRRRIIFDTLRQWVPAGFSFLDAFAGSGAMGIEALSNGAENVYFLDINPKAISSIKKNLVTMPLLIGKSYFYIQNALTPPTGAPVNCIFLDPPYKSSHIIPKVLKKLHYNNWINKETIIVIELKADTEIKIDFEILKTKKSGITKLIFAILNNKLD